jgi:enoyl-CoA hydratase/carnithine racemase
MEHVRVERDGAVLVVTMARGKANALNGAMVDELSHVVAEARDDAGVRGVVLASASDRVFSAGLDFGEVFAYDDDTMRAFLGRFVDLLDGVRTLPKGVVAAVSGHAYAGGALLALACDFRVMADAEIGLAVNEVNLGIVLPTEATRWIVPALGPAAREVVLGGLAVSPQRALQAGIVSSIEPAGRVRDTAIALARSLGEKPPLAFAAVKQGLIDVTTGVTGGASREAFVDAFMTSWTGAESRLRRAALAASMKR